MKRTRIITALLFAASLMYAQDVKVKLGGNDGSQMFYIINTDGDTLSVFTSDGNVGIGTTDPAQKLHVAGSIQADTLKGDGSQLTGAGMDSADFAAKGFVAGAATKEYVDTLEDEVKIPHLTTAERAGISSPATGLQVYDTDKDGYYYYNGTAWINISSGTTAEPFLDYNNPNITASSLTDRLGLGTSSPSCRLHLKMLNTSISGGIRLETSQATSEDWYFYMPANDNLHIRNDASDYVIFEMNTGNVGLGITDPTTRLDVNGTTRTTNLQMTNGAATGYVLQSDGTGNGSWTDPASLATGAVTSLSLTLADGQQQIQDDPCYVPVVAGASATVTKMQCYINTNATPNIEMGIYNSSGTLQSSGSTAPGGTGLISVNLAGSVDLTAGTMYYLGVVDKNNSNTDFKGSNSCWSHKDMTQASLPASKGTTSDTFAPWLMAY